jgi:hypothetical protein
MSTPKPEQVTFNHLIRKVRHAEDALERRERRVGEQARRLKLAWKAGWTPARVLAAGLVSGFLVGRAEPLAKVGGVRWMQMITSLSGLFSSIRAATAADEAEEAADEAGHEADAAEGAADVAAQTGRDDDGEVPRRVGPADRVRAARPHTGEWSSEPRPAEAATEVSERYNAR